MFLKNINTTSLCSTLRSNLVRNVKYSGSSDCVNVMLNWHKDIRKIYFKNNEMRFGNEQFLSCKDC